MINQKVQEILSNVFGDENDVLEALESEGYVIIERDDLQRVLNGEPCNDGAIGEVEHDRWSHAVARLRAVGLEVE